MTTEGLGLISDTNTLRAMIVEDNIALAETLGWMIEALGYDYAIVNTGTQALADAAIFRPHVMMIDIGLPDMTGYDLCKRLRADPSLAETVFVAQTGWDEHSHGTQSRDAGFHHHLTKPVSIEKLENLLKDLQADLVK